MPRHLVSIRRSVPAERRGEYDAVWARLHDTATTRGAHAWRFVSAIRPDLVLEFLEFAADADPRSRPEIADALEVLDQEFGTTADHAAAVEEWREATDLAT